MANAEMRMLLARVVWNFDFKLVNPEVDWLNENKTYFLWEKPEYQLYLTPRGIVPSET